MKGLFRREPFSGFGPAALSLGVLPLSMIRARRPGKLRQLVREQAPRLPGVYGMIDQAGQLIYIGKARSIRSRLMSYFRPKSRDEKAGKIIADTRRIVWERSPCEFAALLRELELIRRWQPHWNVQGKPIRMRRVYICIGRRPAAYAFVAPKPTTRVHVCYGPVAGQRRAREAVRRLNDFYRLRDCPQKQTMIFADQRELFPLDRAPACIRHDIGHCSAPCAAACTQSDYAAQVTSAIDFLEGRDRAPLDHLQKQMIAASANQEYERATLYRDRLDTLAWLADAIHRVRDSAKRSCIYPVTTPEGDNLWYLIRNGVVRALILAPRDDSTRATAAATLDAVFSSPQPDGPPGLHEVDALLLAASWFRKHRHDLQMTITVDSARAALNAESLTLLPLTS